MKTAENLFKQWSGGSYEWHALSDIEKIRWLNLAAELRIEQLDTAQHYYRKGGFDAADMCGKDAILLKRPEEWGFLSQKKNEIITHFTNPNLEIPK